MRTPLLIPVLLFAYAGACHAVLGGAPETFGSAATTAAANTTAAGASYIERATTLDGGTQVREYVSTGGTVFAVTWEGPNMPDLKALLGPYFDTLVAESQKAPRAGRSPVGVNLPEVVINSGGHMRAYEGSAWIPAQLPAGLNPDALR